MGRSWFDDSMMNISEWSFIRDTMSRAVVFSPQPLHWWCSMRLPSLLEWAGPLFIIRGANAISPHQLCTGGLLCGLQVASVMTENIFRHDVLELEDWMSCVTLKLHTSWRKIFSVVTYANNLKSFWDGGWDFEIVVISFSGIGVRILLSNMWLMCGTGVGVGTVAETEFGRRKKSWKPMPEFVRKAAPGHVKLRLVWVCVCGCCSVISRSDCCNCMIESCTSVMFAKLKISFHLSWWKEWWKDWLFCYYLSQFFKW
jgi:hypothetical protein